MAKLSKKERVMEIDKRLIDGETVEVESLKDEFGVSLKSIRRDLADLRKMYADKLLANPELLDETIQVLRNYLTHNEAEFLKEKERFTYMNDEQLSAELCGEAEESDKDILGGIVHYQGKGAFKMIVPQNTTLTNSELFTVIKILLESRALVKEEMDRVIHKLLNTCLRDKESERLEKMIRNEHFYYIPPRHGEKLIEKIWQIVEAIYSSSFMLIEYTKTGTEKWREHLLRPVGVMSSEFYFYVIAYRAKNLEMKEVSARAYPTVYRIDRIQTLTTLEEKFEMPNKTLFQEGEFRKKVQFMYTGKMEKVRFIFKGISDEPVLDRIPSADSHPVKDGFEITAEVYGREGIEMWLRSQGDLVQDLRWFTE